MLFVLNGYLSLPQDYIDACERLSQLNLSEVQQREIIRVVLHCLGNVSLSYSQSFSRI